MDRSSAHHGSSRPGGRGELFILSAPSGAGKTTLIRGLIEGELADSRSLYFAVSHTTRTPRASERPGRDYYFVDEGEFRRMVDCGEFLEWARVHGHHYGTSLGEVVPQLERGLDVLLDIDVQGADRVAEGFSEGEPPIATRVHSIFVMPPSYEALRARLHQRGLDRRQEIARRLAVSHREIERALEYHYVIVNDDAGSASRALASIVLEKRHRSARMTRQVEGIIDDFAARRAAEADPEDGDRCSAEDRRSRLEREPSTEPRTVSRVSDP